MPPKAAKVKGGPKAVPPPKKAAAMGAPPGKAGGIAGKKAGAPPGAAAAAVAALLAQAKAMGPSLAAGLPPPPGAGPPPARAARVRVPPKAGAGRGGGRGAAGALGAIGPIAGGAPPAAPGGAGGLVGQALLGGLFGGAAGGGRRLLALPPVHAAAAALPPGPLRVLAEGAAEESLWELHLAAEGRYQASYRRSLPLALCHLERCQASSLAVREPPELEVLLVYFLLALAALGLLLMPGSISESHHARSMATSLLATSWSVSLRTLAV